MGLAFYSCKEDNPVLPEKTPDTPQPEEAKNISEKSDFESYIDMDTYAGDDFYQYAVGKWLQNNPLKEKENRNGPHGDMVVAMENFIYSQALNSEDEVLKRLNSDFSASTKDADLALLKQKLADIYAISSVDDMYKKMGELMYDGYQTPFVFTCMSNERSVRPYLKQVFEGIDASSSHFEDFAGISETEANLIVDVVKRWKDECWQKEEAESKKMSHYLKELNVVEVSFPPKTRADATSPLEAILTSMGLTSNDIKLLASKAFDALTEKMIAHFNKQTFGDYKCNGKLTVGENTADLGGLYIGYDAFMKLLAKKGVTGDELDRQGREFFRAFAYTWMGNLGTEYIQLINNDVHALDPVRVNGNVYLMDEFYRLFNIKSGKRYLAPADRIEIW
jgi:predicted metalloendopeptidase